MCVITGGGSGMGLAAAKFMPKDTIVVLSGRTEAKLANAVAELKSLGITAYARSCDTSKRESVKELALYAASLGKVTTVINSAGLSPAMSDPETIIRVNALGTVYVNREFSKVIEKGVIVDIASNSAYMLPSFMQSKKIYGLADTDEEKFLKKLEKKTHLAKEGYLRSGFAYTLSKNFVVWYAKKCAYELGPKGIRVVSLSPGLIETDMGNLEKESGSILIGASAEERMGKAEELGFAIASVADERNGYLAGVDVLVDGGSVNGMKEFKKNK